jgi:hypothetical protein
MNKYLKASLRIGSFIVTGLAIGLTMKYCGGFAAFLLAISIVSILAWFDE